jgi:Flp pilus assembly protein TadD
MNEARKVYRPSLYHPAGIVGKTYETDKVIKNYKDQSFKVYARINEGSLTALKNQYLYEPYNVYIKNKYAVVLAQSGRFSEAKDILIEALRFSPNNASILNNLGNIAMQEGNNKEAVQLYEKSHSFDDSDFQTTINLVKAYIKLEDKVSARKWLEIANSIDTRFSEYYNKIINQLK